MILKSVLKGAAVSAALLIFYFLVLTLVSGWNFTLVQFFQNWYWILGLSFGFGVQISLFSYLKEVRAAVSGKAAAASGTVSSFAMIACCSHYLANIIPVIGIAGLATLIGQYQRELFLVGAIFNLVGIGYMTDKLIKFRKTKYEK